MHIAFDIDDTLWRVRQDKMDQVPDFDLIQVLRWFYKNGDTIWFWSAGGIDYCQTIVKKLGLDEFGEVTEKQKTDFMDICFDDMEVQLAKTNIRVKR